MLTVITAAFYASRNKIRYLERSCERNGLTLKVYGLERPYRGYTDAKITELLRALVDVKTEYVMYCDGVDSLVLAEEDEIMESYELARDGKDLVFSADMKCFPYTELGQAFERKAKGSAPLVCKWKGKEHRRIYMNAGVFIGKTKYVKQCLNRLYRMYVSQRAVVEHPEDDQGWWCLGLKNGHVDFAIDYKADIVAMTKYTPDDWYALTPGKCKLKPNGNTPCVMHFAGVNDTNKRMPKFYERLFPNG